MAKCHHCGTDFLQWKKDRHGNYKLQSHPCVPVAKKQVPTMVTKSTPQDRIVDIRLHGVRITNKILDEGLLRELGIE